MQDHHNYNAIRVIRVIRLRIRFALTSQRFKLPNLG